MDKIHGTLAQFEELEEWLFGNQTEVLCEFGDYPRRPVLPSDCLFEYNDSKEIASFPEEIELWLLDNCPISWLQDLLKDKYPF